jgi:predicted ATPase
MQDAAHGSLLRSTRHLLHAKIAEALETDFPALRESQPELFALHYAEAGLVDRSIAYWARAGRRSAARSAMAEAAAQYQKGLDQLALLPESRERRQQELEFWSALGAVLRYAKGQASPEMGHAFARARELWEQLGSPSEFLHVPYGQSRYHMYRGEAALAQRLDEDLLRLSRQRNDSAGLVLGHDCYGRDLLLAGRFAAARGHLEQVLALYDPAVHTSLVQHTGSQPRVVARGYIAIALFCLGLPDQAVAHSKAAIAEARTIAHLPSRAASLAQGARLLSLGDDVAALSERADQLIAVATEQGFPLYRALGKIYHGWVKVRNGELGEGISLVRSGASAYRTIGAESRVPYYIALLARACAIAGEISEAISLLDEARQIADEIGERWYMAELRRHKGQLLLRQGRIDQAEAHYREALSIASEQEAKLFELRAALGLARVSRDRRHHAEADERLAHIYGWFTEGFATSDLRSAKALLDERTGRQGV